MKLTTLDEDLRIHQKLEDEPNDVGGLSAQELKKKFDQAGVTIQKYLNETHLPEEEKAVADALSEAKEYADKKTAAVTNAVSQARAYTDQKAAELSDEVSQVRDYADRKAAELSEGLSQARAYTDQKTAALEQGSMKTAVYDTKKRNRDVFDYTDEKFEALKAQKSGGAWQFKGDCKVYCSGNSSAAVTGYLVGAMMDPYELWSEVNQAVMVPDGGKFALVFVNAVAKKPAKSESYVKLMVNGIVHDTHTVGAAYTNEWMQETVVLAAMVTGRDEIRVVGQASTQEGAIGVAQVEIEQVGVIIFG